MVRRLAHTERTLVPHAAMAKQLVFFLKPPPWHPSSPLAGGVWQRGAPWMLAWPCAFTAATGSRWPEDTSCPFPGKAILDITST